MSDYKVSGQLDEPKQRVGEAFWPDYLLSLNIVWTGVNNRLPAEKLGQGLVADAQNVRMRTGDIEPRYGVVKPGWLNGVNANQVMPAATMLYGVGVFNDPNSREWVIYAGDGLVWACAPNNQRQAVGTPPGVVVAGPCSFVQAFNQFFCFRGRYLAPLVLKNWNNGFQDIVAHYDGGTTLPIAAGNLTSSGTTATAVFVSHGLSVDQSIKVTGAVQTAYNGTFTVASVIDANTFTYTMGGSASASPATGSIYVATAPNTTYNAAIQAIEQDADEVAYGPFLAAASSGLTSVANLATFVTSQPHGYVTGADITVKGANQPEYNGRYTILVIDPYTFTYNFVGSATATATGTIECSNMSEYWEALGDQLTIGTGNLTGSGTTATVNYTGHGLQVGNYITVSGATQVVYNGTFQVQTVADANHFTYTLPSAETVTPATGTILVTKPTVAPGNNPDTAPASWSQIFDVLPNADQGVYVNGRLLVPTAYTPGDNGYDSTSTWTKVDYIVALNINDPVHFEFVDGFRINQGDDSEITNIVPYDNSTCVVTKGKRWGFLSGLTAVENGTLNNVTWTAAGAQYGCESARSALTAGKNVFFPSPLRGLTGVNQTQQGVLQSVDVPLSTDIQAWVNRINWSQRTSQRVAWCNDYLYWAVAIDSSLTNNAMLVYDFRNAQWASLDTGTELGVVEFFHATVYGQDRLFFLGTNGFVNLMEEAAAGDQIYVAPGQNFVGTLGGNWSALGAPGVFEPHVVAQNLTIGQQYYLSKGNALRMSTYEDTVVSVVSPDPNAITTSGVFTATQTLYFLAGPAAVAGLPCTSAVYLYANGQGGPSCLRWTPIATSATLAGHFFGQPGQKQFNLAEILVGVWGATLTVTMTSGGERTVRGAVTNKTFSRTNYLKPFNALPWNPTNAGNDWGNPNRGDYSVLMNNGLNLTGMGTLNYQEIFLRPSTRGFRASYALITIANSTGRLVIKAVTPAAQSGERRMGFAV